jgi:hypothetical protein
MLRDRRSHSSLTPTDDALKILENLTHPDSELEGMIRESSLNAAVAQLIYDARSKAGLTQQHLRLGLVRSSL